MHFTDVPFTSFTSGLPIGPDISAGPAGQKGRQIHMPHVPGSTVCPKGKQSQCKRSSHSPLLEEYGVFQMYAISTKAKDIRSVVVELNTKRADIDLSETKPQTRPQPANPTRHQDSHWGSFLTQVSSCDLWRI